MSWATAIWATGRTARTTPSKTAGGNITETVWLLDGQHLRKALTQSPARREEWDC